MAARGLIRRALGSRQLLPGPRWVRLGLNAVRTSLTADAAHALLIGLAARLGEHCQVGVVSGAEVMYVDSACGARGVGLQFEPGEHLPFGRASTGKLFLAEMSDSALPGFLGRRPLRRYMQSTVTDPAALIAQGEEVWPRGWASTDGEYAAGVVECAVPIQDGKDAMLFSLAIAIPTVRTPFSAITRFLPALRAVAKVIGAALATGRSAR